MTDVSTDDNSVERPIDVPGWAPWLAGVLLLAGLVAIGLGAASQGWPVGFVYLAIMIEIFLVNVLSVAIWNPVLMGRRVGIKSGTKGWDYLILLVGFTPGILGMFAAAWWQSGEEGLAAIDGAWWAALLILGLGWGFANWSMIINPFFEKTVRIQTEHGHRVIDTGPYAYMRHPGYVGFLAWILTTPVLLGSSLAWWPAALAAGALVLRTQLEDQTLQAELTGYAEYAERVRYRLIPGIW